MGRRLGDEEIKLSREQESKGSNGKENRKGRDKMEKEQERKG